METFFIKLNGKANIPEPLEIDKNYHVSADCSITQIRRDSNENGEYNVTYKAEPLKVEILKENGKIIKAKDPRKNSQKLRNYLFKIYAQEGYTEDFDKVYDEATLVIMSMIPIILTETIKRLNN